MQWDKKLIRDIAWPNKRLVSTVLNWLRRHRREYPEETILDWIIWILVERTSNFVEDAFLRDTSEYSLKSKPEMWWSFQGTDWRTGYHLTDHEEHSLHDWNSTFYLICFPFYLYCFFNFLILFFFFSLCRRFNVKLKNSSYIEILRIFMQIGHCRIPFPISWCYRNYAYCNLYVEDSFFCSV